MNFNQQALALDAEPEAARLVRFIQQIVRQSLRRGGVVGISGGIDSAVVLALAIRAFGPRNVVAVMIPDKDSEPISETTRGNWRRSSASSRCWRTLPPR